MKIAVAVSDNKASMKLGQSEELHIFEIFDRDIKMKTIEKYPAGDCTVIGPFLKGHSIDVVISGCMGQGDRECLRSRGIKALTGAKGDPEKAVEDYICWSAELDENVCIH